MVLVVIECASAVAVGCAFVGGWDKSFQLVLRNSTQLLRRLDMMLVFKFGNAVTAAVVCQAVRTVACAYRVWCHTVVCMQPSMLFVPVVPPCLLD